jgi:hypothetical protein
MPALRRLSFLASADEDRISAPVDATPIAAEHSTAGGHHPGVLIAHSSRFSRRKAGIPSLVTAIVTLGDQAVDDRIVYLERPAES